jgi:diguanylate cyclase (GGDEF)-like protein
LGRWGGEEFLVLMPETEAAVQAHAAMTRLKQQLQAAPMSGAIPELRVTFSCGVTTRGPGDTIEQVIERADHAVYRAKHSGRDRTELEPPLTRGRGADPTSGALPESAQCGR